MIHTTRARCFCAPELEPALERAAATHPHAAAWARYGEWFEIKLDLPHLSPIERGLERVRVERWLMAVVRAATRPIAYADWLASGGHAP